jgi:tRNA U55 pseudouridine synthase TruB
VLDFGHQGAVTATLDPQATGLLSFVSARQTKLAQFVKQNKKYLAEMALGYVSTTLTATGSCLLTGDKTNV